MYTSVGVGTLILAATLVLSHRVGPAKRGSRVQEVVATVETEPVSTGGDSADDPALWVNPADPQLSLVIGTNKKRGLEVYDLSGKEIQFLADGELNNVDSRDDFPLDGKKVPIVTASNRSNNSIAIYKINAETRRLENVAAGVIKTNEAAYGACMYRSNKTGKFYYIGASKHGVVEQYELFDAGQGTVNAKKVRQINVGTQLEGCVADDELGYLYVGEENVAIWKYQAEPDANSERTKVDGVGNGNLVADIEGLTIAYGTDGKGYLIASSQGNDTFAVYRREGTNAYVKSFRIMAGKIDRVTNTDGIHATTANLGPLFPKGVFIAQDGSDDSGKQNFKLVPWQSIEGN